MTGGFPIFTTRIGGRRTLEPAPVPAPAPGPGPELSAPAPTPSAPSAPAYVSGTQLLTNPEFTEITRIGPATDPLTGSANGWTSSREWQAWGYSSGSAPTARLEMPQRSDGVRVVYPLSSGPNGFVIFSYATATISQTVTISSLTGINTITGVLNIVNVPNRPSEESDLTRTNDTPDTFTFQIQYRNRTGGTLLTTKSTRSQQVPPTWTDVPLTLTRAEAPYFDDIKSITVNITGLDSGYWGGQYGPAVDYCRLTVS